jgi:DNA polymerase-3 subunit epsilon
METSDFIALGTGLLIFALVLGIFNFIRFLLRPQGEDRPIEAERKDPLNDTGRAPAVAEHAQPEPRTITSKRPPPDLPGRVLFFDTETTGLKPDDRIVSLAAIKLATADWPSKQMPLQYFHLIFDPGRKSHPRAEEVHGYGDRLLRHQDDFSEHAVTITEFFGDADLLVAHNADFDIDFYNRELRRCGIAPNATPVFCTMNAYRGIAVGGASLTAICRQLGIGRASHSHDALEDAWLAMQVYFWLNERPYLREFAPGFLKVPINLKEAPPLPEGTLPRRRLKRPPRQSGINSMA